jgi:hypothetical protein
MASKARALLRANRAPLAAIIVVPVLLMVPALLPGRVLSSADAILQTYFFSQVQPAGFVPANALISDTVYQHTAWRRLVLREIHAGRMPFWNPYAFCGSPLLGNSQSAVFDILNFPYLLIGDPLSGTVWVVLLRLWIAGLGTYFFSRRIGVSRAGATLAGIAYQCGGFMIIWLMAPHVSSAAWFPWAMLGAEILGTHGGVRPAAGLGLALAASAFGGHAEVAFFGAMAASVYAVVRRGQTRAWRMRELLGAAGGIALAGLLAAAIAAVQILPLLETLAGGTSPEARAQLARQPVVLWPWQFPTSRLVLLFFPYLYGRPVGGEPSFAPAWTNFCEYSGPYVSSFGALLALLAIATAARRSVGRPLALLWCTAWLYSVYCPPLLAAARRLPAFDVAVPQRCVFAALFSAAVLAGLGLDRLGAFSGRKRRLVDIGAATTIGATAIAGLTAGCWLLSGAPGFRTVVRVLLSAPFRSVFIGIEQKLQMQTFELASVFASLYVRPWAILLLGAAVWFFFEKRAGRARGATAVALVALDLLWFAHSFNPAIPRAYAFPRAPAMETLAGVANGGRVLVLDHGLPPNSATFYGIADILGYDAIGRKRLERLLRLAGPFPAGPLEAPLVHFDRYESWVLDVLGVRVVASPRALPVTYLKTGPTQGTVYYYQNPRAFPYVWCPSHVVTVSDSNAAERSLRDPAFEPKVTAIVEAGATLHPKGARGNLRWARPAPARIEIEANLAEGGLVVVSESYDPGWQAVLDGSRVPTYPCDLALLGVQLPAGAHRITFVFAPRTWPLAVALSSLGLAGILAILLWARRTAKGPEGHRL